MPLTCVALPLPEVGSLAFFQFPTVLPEMLLEEGQHVPLLEPLPSPPQETVKEEEGKPANEAPTEAPTVRPAGRIGTVREHASGRVTLQIGDLSFDVPLFFSTDVATQD